MITLKQLNTAMFGGMVRRLAGSRSINAAAWSSMALVVGQLFRIVGSLVMTRLLIPEMFGVMSIVLVVQMTLALLSDIGTKTVIVQSSRGDDPDFVNTAWTLDVIRGGAIWIVSIAIAIGLAAAASANSLSPETAWASPELPVVLAVTTFAAVISGLQSTKLTTATRKLQLREVALIEIGAQVGGLVCMITVGLLTRSIWALVAGAMVTTLITTIATHLLLPGAANRLTWDTRAIKEIYTTGRWVLLSSAVFVLASNIDRFLLAGFATAANLGLYSIALNFVLLVESLGTRLFWNVALPALSETARERPAQFRHELYRLRLPTDLGFLAASGLIYAVGPTIVDILYDDRYLAAGHMLQILAVSLVFGRFGVLNMAYVALGEARLMANVHVVKLLSIAVLLPVLFHFFAFDGALWAVALHAAPSVVYMLAANRAHGLNDFRHELKVLPAWPLGYLIGALGVGLLGLITG